MAEESGSEVRLLDRISVAQVEDMPPVFAFSHNGYDSAVRVPLDRLRFKDDVDHALFNAWGFYPLAELSPKEWTEALKQWSVLPDFLEYGKRGRVMGVDRERLVNDLMECYSFKTILGTARDEILIYQSGLYVPKGEETIKRACEARVQDPALTRYIINEIVGHIARQTATERSLFDTELDTLNFNNGLLDCRTRGLRPHSRRFLSTVRIPVTYDPEAKCPQIEQFLSEILKPEHIPLIYEIAGYAMLPEYTMQQAFIFTGDGSNGKSTMLSLFGAFLGSDNCSSISLQHLEESDFAASFLVGKLLNVVADISPERIRSDRAMFKRLTGGDLITTEKKFKDPFTFTNYAKLIFSAQIPPKTSDESYAFWRRWIMVNFPYKFEGDAVDRSLMGKLTTPKELSGFLNLALDGLARIRANNQFSYNMGPRDVRAQWTLGSEPAKAFVQDYCNIDSSAEILREDLYKAYEQFCLSYNIPLCSEDSFGRALHGVPGLSLRRKQHRVEGKFIQHIAGIALNDEGQELLAADWS